MSMKVTNKYLIQRLFVVLWYKLLLRRMSISQSLFLTILLFTLLVSAKPEPNLHGTWKYTSIIKNQKIIAAEQGSNIPFGDWDTMNISTCRFRNNPKKQPCIFWFSYSIPSLKKAACGTGKWIQVPTDSSKLRKALIFEYQSTSSALYENNSTNPSNPQKTPVIVRTFNIAYLSQDSLSIREGNTYFNYRKVR